MSVLQADESLDRIRASLAKRHRAEARFQWCAKLAVGLAGVMLCYLLISIAAPGLTGFVQHQVRVQMPDAQLVADADGNYHRLANEALRALFPEVTKRGEKRQLAKLLSPAAPYVLEKAIRKKNGQVQVWLPLMDGADLYLKGRTVSTLSDQQKAWIDRLYDADDIGRHFNSGFFTQGDSREPDQAGFLGSIVGSFFTMIVCLVVSFSIGVMAAIYLEEFAAKNWFTHLIEVNINNLAAVPSIIFGLLGLAVFLVLFGLPRSSALVGGLTLSLLTLPVIIISTRIALQAVPPSMREAARGLGASPLQVVMHHVVPYALPGIMTGTILGMARAIGETAPLLMIGMVAFIADVPSGFLEPATAMPVQIYIWASSPELGFVEKTSTGVLVLLMMLGLINVAAVWVRRKYEVKW